MSTFMTIALMFTIPVAGIIVGTIQVVTELRNKRRDDALRDTINLLREL